MKKITSILTFLLILAGLTCQINFVMAASHSISTSLEIKPTDIDDIEDEYFENNSSIIYLLQNQQKPTPNEDNIDSQEDLKYYDILKIVDLSINDFLVISDEIINSNFQIILTEKSPIFSGKVNAPFAFLFFKVFSDNGIVGQTQADKDGNWQWQVPVELEAGNHTLYLAANISGVLPEPKDYYAIDFRIAEDTEDTAATTTTDTESIRQLTDQEKEILSDISIIDINLDILNTNKEITPGLELHFSLETKDFSKLSPDQNILVILKNSQGEIMQIKEFSQTELKAGVINDEFYIPENYSLGDYYLESQTVFNNYRIANTIGFKVIDEKNIPFIGNVKINTDNEANLIKIACLMIIILTLAIIIEIAIFIKYHSINRKLNQKKILTKKRKAKKSKKT